MPSKKINLNFFQLQPIASIDENIKEEIDAIKNVFNVLPTTYNPVIRTDTRVSLYGRIEKRGGLFLGTLVNNQTNDIPPAFDEEQNTLNALPLTENQGLGYQTSFLYDPALRIVMIESVRNGITIGAFCRFLAINFQLPTIEPVVVINPADMQQLYNMTTITKFQVRIARVENGQVFDQNKKSIGQITHSADNTNNDMLEYSVSVRGGHGDSLALTKVKNWARAFLRFKETEEVKVLKVTGKENDEESADTIDFIKQRFRDFIEVEKYRLISSFDIKEHYSKLLEVYNRHKKSLQVYKHKSTE